MYRNPFDRFCNNIEKSIERASHNVLSDVLQSIEKRAMYILENTFYYFENGKEIWKTTCVTGKNGFGCEPQSGKTPFGLHKIQEKIGDGCHIYQKFIAKKPVETIGIPVHETGVLTPGVYTRILTLTGMEKENSNTFDRCVYIHGNIHYWYWKTENLKRTNGCIGLLPEDMKNIFEIVKSIQENIYVYIEPKKLDERE